METMLDICGQEAIEETFNRKHIDARIREAIEADLSMQAKVEHGIELVNQFLKGDYYPSKMTRLTQLKNMSIPELVIDMFVGVAYSLHLELFTSVSAQISSRLGLNDRTEAITTVAELLAILCETDAFDICKEKRQDSLMLISRIPLPQELIEFIEHSQYLPPMVCEPLKLSHNHSSGYLTHNDSLILGAGNHHDGDISLDVLNTMNKVKFQLDIQFLSKVEEDMNTVVKSLEDYEHWVVVKKMRNQYPTYQSYLDSCEAQWGRFKKQSYFFYSLMAKQGNQLWFTNKVDKRGRIYASGYHINPQGAPFKKAMLELANEELVEGVPT